MGLNRFICLIVFVLPFLSKAENSDSLKLTKGQKAYIITTSVGVVGGYAGLYQLWYANYPQSKFHFINDNHEWKQMDKFGHGFSAYTLSETGFSTCQSLGFNKKRSLIYGGLLGLVFQTPIEIFDGFSKEWGASTGDLLANTTGWALFYSQQALLDKQVVRMKWGYQNSGYASLRPNVLGSNFSERILKDYNAQTYWFSANIKDITKIDKMPSWLNLAIGYGANGMIGGSSNLIFDKQGNFQFDYRNIERYRTYSASLDIDLSRIKTNNKALKGIFRYINWLKVPFPSITYDRYRGITGQAIGF